MFAVLSALSLAIFTGCNKSQPQVSEAAIDVIKDMNSDILIEKIDKSEYDGFSGDLTPMEAVSDDTASGMENAEETTETDLNDFSIENTLPADDGARIICWGDSLTEGTGGGGVNYPDVLAELSGRKVLNYGVYAERASLIAGRQGGNPQHVEEISQIPAAVTPVKVNVVGDNGDWEMWCNNGDAGINPCSIAGVLGELSIDTNDGSRYFTRLKAGEAVEVSSENNRFETHAMKDMRDNDILVIWAGSSDGLFDDRSIDTVVNHIKSMIKYAGCSRYVIINYTAKFNIGDAIDEWNTRLQSEFGDNCLDIRGYLLAQGLSDAGITPTEEDNKCIAEGEIPKSLRSDESHGTAEFYRIVGEQVYAKLVALGYIKQ